DFSARSLVLRDEPHNPAAIAIRHHVERAVGALLDIADPRVQLGQQALLGSHPLPVQHETDQMLSGKRTHEEALLPAGEQLAGVKADAGWCDVGRPEIDGLFHARLRRAVSVDRLPVVIMAVADHRKAIVPAFRDRVDLVATPRAMLAHPQLPGPRVDGHALVVADAERVDLRPGSLAADEWIVPGN